MSWYKLSKDYVESIEQSNPKLQPEILPGFNSQKEKPEQETLEQQLSNQAKKKPFVFPVNQFLNSTPDTMKAGGQGALYNAKEHADVNMPPGGDNYTKTTNWNEN